MTSPALTHRAIRDLRLLQRHRGPLAADRFIVEGIRPTIAALKSGFSVETLVLCDALLRSEALWNAIARSVLSPDQILHVGRETFAGVATRDRPQGVLCVVRRPQAALPAMAPTRLGWIALVEPQDPGNVGTILRVCAAVHCEGVVLIGGTDPFHPKAIRAAMGATFEVPIYRSDLDALVRFAANHALPLVGAVPHGGMSYRSSEITAPCILLMGRERTGLGVPELARCDATVSIPMGDGADSLNLAIASSLLLFELFHQAEARIT